MNRFRTGALLFAAMLIWAAVVQPAADACPFCEGGQTPTLVNDFRDSAMVLYGSFTNPKLGAMQVEGTSDFVIEKVLKDHEYLKGVKNTITLPRYITSKSKFVVFVNIYKGSLDPYRGIETQANGELVKYLEGAVKLQGSKQPERLRFCFDFLNSSDFDVSMDAFREYAKADYKDYQHMAAKLPADVIAGWLRDPKTPAYRYGLYSSLLGHCGGPEHAKLLRSMIDDPEKKRGSGVDGMLFSYVLLQPKEGWSFLQEQLKTDKQEFLFRYACLRTVRFLWDLRPDVIPRAELAGGAALVLAHADIADFGIEDLRRWQRWEMTDKVLDLYGQKSHSANVIKRAILRFALASPEKRAAEFVRQQRQRDPDWVRDTEELLKIDNDTSTSVPAKTK